MDSDKKPLYKSPSGVEVIEATNRGDINTFKSDLHEDFLFIKDYQMQNREEYLEDLEELFKKNYKVNHPRVILENQDLLVLNHEVSENSKRYLVTVVALRKDGRAWRIITNRRELKP